MKKIILLGFIVSQIGTTQWGNVPCNIYSSAMMGYKSEWIMQRAYPYRIYYMKVLDKSGTISELKGYRWNR